VSCGKFVLVSSVDHEEVLETTIEVAVEHPMKGITGDSRDLAFDIQCWDLAAHYFRNNE
jgi:hypothetical protein